MVPAALRAALLVTALLAAVAHAQPPGARLPPPVPRGGTASLPPAPAAGVLPPPVPAGGAHPTATPRPSAPAPRAGSTVRMPAPPRAPSRVAGQNPGRASPRVAGQSPARASSARTHAPARHREQREAAAARRAAAEAARSPSIPAAIERLEREQARREAAEARSRARARASASASASTSAPAQSRPTHATAPTARAMPVTGQVLHGYGARGADGQPSHGLTWQAAPGARVVSPCTGRVAFAGHFRSYGRMVILDCGEQQHVVLAGFGQVAVQPGRRVQAGDPLGQVAEPSGHPHATLYCELRLRGQPADPGPWLAGRASRLAQD